MKARDLPADLIREWAQRQTAASAKLEGRALPEGYVRPDAVHEFLRQRMQQSVGPVPPAKYSTSQLIRNANGEICVVMPDDD